MKQTIKIKEIRDKVGKNEKPYWVVVTPEGGITCFDEKLVKGLRENIGKTAEVDILVSGDYKNLKEFYTFTDAPIEEEQAISPATDKFANARQEKNLCMKVAYGKDLVNGGMTKEDAVKTINYLWENL